MTTHGLVFNNPNKKTISTIGLGVFDGIHRGHQQLLNQTDALLTFEPHPISLLKNIVVKRLTTAKEMPHYINCLITLPFTTHIATMNPLTFLNDIILTEISPKHIVVGYDYHFGHNREGNLQLLEKWGKENKIKITTIEPYSYKNKLIKSRMVRQAITTDDFNEAIDWLGHSYLIKGTVIKGEGRGKTIGFPTANISVPENKCIPQKGVYQGTVEYNHHTYKAMIYIGNKPTFISQETGIEVHLLDFNDNLYNKTIDIFITRKIRNQQQFNSSNELIEQIKKDIHTCYND